MGVLTPKSINIISEMSRVLMVWLKKKKIWKSLYTYPFDILLLRCTYPKLWYQSLKSLRLVNFKNMCWKLFLDTRIFCAILWKEGETPHLREDCLRLFWSISTVAKEPSLMLLGNSVIIYSEIGINFYRAKLLRPGKHMKDDIREQFWTGKKYFKVSWKIELKWGFFAPHNRLLQNPGSFHLHLILEQEAF